MGFGRGVYVCVEEGREMRKRKEAGRGTRKCWRKRENEKELSKWSPKTTRWKIKKDEQIGPARTSSEACFKDVKRDGKYKKRRHQERRKRDKRGR